MAWVVPLLAYSLMWAVVGVLTGWIANRLPDRFLDSDRGPLRLLGSERSGRVHDRWLRVRLWKDRLPDAGAIFAGGVRKDAVLGYGTESLQRFAMETRRAEWVHWANLVFGLSFWLWAPTTVAVLMTAFGVVAHAPFIVVQRHNRARTERILERRLGATTPTRGLARRIGGGVLGVVVVAAVVLAVGAVRSDGPRPVSVREANLRAGDLGLGRRSRPLVPAEGVYVYRGEGTERLAWFPEVQQGPTVPVTVEHGADGCWSMRADFHSLHWQTWEYCASGGDLLERGGSSSQTFDLVAVRVSATTTTSCPARTVAASPSDAVGRTRVAACSVDSSGAEEPLTTRGTSTRVGTVELTVDGERRSAMHYRSERDISGAQTGTDRTDTWFDATSGLPLRLVRRTELRTDSPIGALTYVEDASFELTELRPAR